MQIDIYVDTVCPWCLIGKHHFDDALADRPEMEPAIAWRTYQLNPYIPRAGLPRAEYLTFKYGDLARGRRVDEQIAANGRAIGIDIRFDRIDHVPNTIDSHRLLRFAADHDRQGQVLDALFHSYFFDGDDIGDADTLAGIGRAAGLPAAALNAVMETDDYRDEVAAEETRGRRLGLEGVPTFIFDTQFTLAGAQDKEAFLPMLDLAISC